MMNGICKFKEPFAQNERDVAFEKWYSMQRHQLTNEVVCRHIWDQAWATALTQPAPAQDEREAFDKYAADEELYTERNDDGIYISGWTHREWLGWQARAALTQTASEHYREDADADFYRGVIAALAVLNAHGHGHGSTIHEEIVRSVGADRLYAAAETDDFRWAGLDAARKEEKQ